jgi:hypothetical protein
MRRAWPATVVLVTAATLGAACGDGGGEAAGDGEGATDVETVDFEATGAFLASASERSAAEPYRFEMSLAMTIAADGQNVDVAAPFSSGAVRGDAFAQTIDLNEYMSQMASTMGAGASMPNLDLTMETVVDGETMWLRAPMFAQLGELGASALPPGLAELGDGWGRIDISSLGPEAVTEAAGLTGSPTAGDPRQVLAMLETADDVTELGEDAVDGDPVDGIGASMTMRELAESGGTDVDGLTEQVTAQAGDEMTPEQAETVTQAMLETEVPIEAWVDDDGYVRRIVMTIDLGETISGLGEQAGAPEQFVVGTTVEFTDYGDEGIDVAPPPEAADAVDLTEAFAQLGATG